MKRFLAAAVAFGMTMPAVAGNAVVTPIQGSLGNPFSDDGVDGWTWADAQVAPSLIGNLYDNIMTINGGAATAGFFGPFGIQGTRRSSTGQATKARPTPSGETTSTACPPARSSATSC